MSANYLSGTQDEREQHWQDLLRQQRELEDEGMARGAERFRKRLEQAQEHERGSNLGAARKLMSNAINPLEDAIRYYVNEQKSKRGIKHCLVKWIERLSQHTVREKRREGSTTVRFEIVSPQGDVVATYATRTVADEECAKETAKLCGADIAAYMTVKVIFDKLAGAHNEKHGRRLTLRDASSTLVSLLLDELRFRRFEERAPGLFKYKINSFTTTSYAHMARSLNASMRFAKIEISDLDMVPSQRLLVGTKLIDLLVQATTLVTVEAERTTKSVRGKLKHNNELYITPTPSTVAFMRERNSVLEFMAPVNLPMVVPPLQWAAGERGGYRYALRGKYALIRATSKSHEEKVAHSEMPEAYTALNAIQNTAWKVNQNVLDLINTITAHGGGIAGIPKAEREELPERPHDIEENEVARKAWRKAAHAVKEENHMRDCRVLEFSKVIATAERMKAAEAIFFPHNLDFRGRIYPVTTFLSPQGDDLSKGLLTFSQGKALGVGGARWLAIHGANCMDTTPQGQKVSKMTLDERVQWVEDNTERIVASALDPVAEQWWSEAEEPLMFFAFCCEWMKYKQEGPSYECSLPVSQDGSCNGLQHFSALLRDERGGMAVNLVPQDRPRDVYDDIRQSAENWLEERAADNPLAAKWLGSGLINRKLAKRPTMTFSYGSKPYGFQQQIAEHLMGLEEWPEVKVLFTEVGTNGKEAVKLGPPCALMSQAIWNSLREVVVAAFSGMEWLQKCAREVVKTGKPVEWHVPITGFQVRQEYFVTTRKQVNTVLAGRVVKPRVYEATDEVQAYKQANAVAPNVVHSLDAAALMLTIAQCSAEGVENFAAVHDSYGTLAADMAILSRATRQCFVKLYQSVDVVDHFHQEFIRQAAPNAPIPAPPAKGNLDLSAVLASDYFFA